MIQLAEKRLALLPRESAHRLDRLWILVQETCPLPLLDHWQAPVLALLHEREMLRSLPMALGPLQGFRLNLDVPALTDALGELIRCGVLSAYPSSQPATALLELDAVA